MRLFEIDENYQVKPNKVWIGLIPELVLLLNRDRGSKGDADGRKKLKARREFTFIYFYMDFGSPLRDYDNADKEKEALIYAGLTKEDIDQPIIAACKKYEELQVSASRSLRTYRSMVKGMDALDTFFEKVNFTEVDKHGQQVHSPDKFVNNIAKMNKAYDELRIFEKRVEDDLKNVTEGIRGSGTLGDNEARRGISSSTWSEQDISERSAVVAEGANHNETAPAFMSMAKIISKQNHLTDQQIQDSVVYGEKDEDKE